MVLSLYLERIIATLGVQSSTYPASKCTAAFARSPVFAGCIVILIVSKEAHCQVGGMGRWPKSNEAKIRASSPMHGGSLISKRRRNFLTLSSSGLGARSGLHINHVMAAFLLFMGLCDLLCRSLNEEHKKTKRLMQ